jgi:hypothetical protein
MGWGTGVEKNTFFQGRIETGSEKRHRTDRTDRTDGTFKNMMKWVFWV